LAKNTLIFKINLPASTNHFEISTIRKINNGRAGSDGRPGYGPGIENAVKLIPQIVEILNNKNNDNNNSNINNTLIVKGLNSPLELALVRLNGSSWRCSSKS
jgi:hypothetical protein